MANYWDEDLAILSAENVSFSIETAGLGSRFAAFSLDTFYQLLVYTLLALGAWGVEGYVISFADMPRWLSSVLIGFYFLITFALFFGYYFVFECLWDGQTPGKRYFGLRVMLANGLPLNVTAALARNVVRVVDFLPMCYGFGSVVALSNPLNQRMGDLAAGTIVVRENKLEKQRKPLTINQAVEAFLRAATTVPTKAEGTPFLEDEELHIETAPRLDADALALSRQMSREDYELARDFLGRRDQLPPAVRERLGQSLALRLSAKLGEAPPLNYEAKIEGIVADLRKIYA